MDESSKVTISERFSSVYANSVQLEATLLDLKLILGEVQLAARGGVQLHTSVTMTWPLVKGLALDLALYVQAQERESGLIAMPEAMMQPELRHLAAAPIARLIAEAVQIRSGQKEPPSSATVRPN
jgi:hypothetical protein